MSRACWSPITVVLTSLVAVSAAAQSTVPIVTVPNATVVSQQTFGAILGLNHLSNGDVIVNDAGRRQVLKLSPQLATSAVIIDSAPGTSRSYGSRPTPLIRYLGDSSLFVDPSSQSLLVIDPNGKIARTMSAPNPRDLTTLASTPAYIDPKGRLIYRGSMVMQPAAGRAPSAPPSGVPPMPLLRADFDRRTVDTVGLVKTGSGIRGSMAAGPDGKMQIKRLVDPLFVPDDYAVLSDGTVAIVRGQDYHVDLVTPDGSTTKGRKLPFDWKKLSDEDKERLRDSVLKAPQPRLAQGASSVAMPNTASGGGASFTIGAAGGGALETSRITSDMLASGAASLANATTTVDVIPISEMADYLPSIRAGAARPDLDGNVWLLPNTSARSLDGELVYDIVNTTGALTHRVRVPKGRSVVGFGAGGIVYLMVGDRAKGFTLERSTVPAVP